MNDIYTISIIFGNYEELFYEFDYRPLNNRDLSEELDTFILSRATDLSSVKNTAISLEINLPKSVYSKEREVLTYEGISNHYDSKIEWDKKLTKIAIKRLTYYFTISMSLFIFWYFSQSILENSILSVLLDTGATVVLWQIMTVLFIERKDYNLKKNLNKLFSQMDIKFKYF